MSKPNLMNDIRSGLDKKKTRFQPKRIIVDIVEHSFWIRKVKIVQFDRIILSEKGWQYLKKARRN
jgi:hypothetical protein